MLKVRAVVRAFWRPWLTSFISRLCRARFQNPWLLQMCTLRALQVCLNERRMLNKERVVERVQECVAEVERWVVEKIGGVRV